MIKICLVLGVTFLVLFSLAPSNADLLLLHSELPPSSFNSLLWWFAAKLCLSAVSFLSQLSLQYWALESFLVPFFFTDSQLYNAETRKLCQVSPVVWISGEGAHLSCQLDKLCSLHCSFVRWDAKIYVLKRPLLEVKQEMCSSLQSPSKYIKMKTVLLTNW